jgi:predicted lipoprotein with Yx(FWY)xxD motif
VTLIAAGCGGAIPSSDGGPATLKLDGSYLVDGQGHSVYLFLRDQTGESYCSGACAAVWPPLETSTRPHGGAGVQGGALGTIKRPDGDLQVTYHGHPLYYYAADASTPGKTTGEDIDQFGASWYLVRTSGAPYESSSSGSGSGGGGGGYG